MILRWCTLRMRILAALVGVVVVLFTFQRDGMVLKSVLYVRSTTSKTKQSPEDEKTQAPSLSSQHVDTLSLSEMQRLLLNRKSPEAEMTEASTSYSQHVQTLSSTEMQRLPLKRTMASCAGRVPRGRDWAVFTALVDVLRDVGADWWLHGGTLLGFVRECRLFDSDIDVVVTPESLASGYHLWRERLTEARFDIGTKPGGLKLTKDETVIDMYLVSPNGTHYATQVFKYVCPKPLTHVGRYDWFGLEVRVPEPFEEVLRANYGATWGTPRHMSARDKAKDIRTSGRCIQTGSLDVPPSAVIVCVDGWASFLQAFVLSRQMRVWRYPEAALEVYHQGYLSAFLAAELEMGNSFVRIVHLPEQTGRATCIESAMRTTLLPWALGVNDPTVFFFTSPTERQCSLYFGDARFSVNGCDHRLRRARRETVSLNADKTPLGVIGYHERSPEKPVWIKLTRHVTSMERIATLVDMDRISVGANGGYAGTREVICSWLKQFPDLYRAAKRLMLLDRPLRWIAFDGGAPLAPLNSLTGYRTAKEYGADIVNVDVVLTKDLHLVANHNDTHFTPFVFDGNVLPRPMSTMTSVEARQLLSPCVPLDDAVRHVSGASSSSCEPARLALVEEFFRQFSTDRILFDVKPPSEELQIQALNKLEELAHQYQMSIMVRLFPSKPSPNAAVDLLSRGRQPQRSGNSEKVLYYANFANDSECSAFVSEGVRRGFNESHLGCFLLRRENKGYIKREVTDLDMPRLIDDVFGLNENLPMLRRRLHSSVKSGIDWVLSTPFAGNGRSTSSLPEVSVAISRNDVARVVERSMEEHLKRDIARSEHSQQRRSAWGVATSIDWSQTAVLDFRGGSVDRKPHLPEHVTTRCVGKTLVTMLVLRLQEVGLLDIAATVFKETYTWKDMLSNKAGFTSEGQRHSQLAFRYSNYPWRAVPDAIEAISGMSFHDALRQFVTIPMGITGKFNEGTNFPPYAARGFVGTVEDLVLIGATLANGGISPKTRKTVVSADSVAHMLADQTVDVKESFLQDTVRLSMRRFEKAGARLPDGYGLGLWRVTNWTAAGVRGWLSMGGSEAAVYFDETGLVVAMTTPDRIERDELTLPMAKVIADLDVELRLKNK